MAIPPQTRRRFLAGGAIVVSLAAILPAISKALAPAGATPVEHVTVSDFAKPGDIDDSEAFRRALATGKPVYAPGGKGRGPGGRYLVASTPEQRLPNGAHVFGDGADKTILRRSYERPAAFIFFCDSGSADPTKNLTGLMFRDLTFEDDVATTGFSEFEYLVMLNGVTNATIERVTFRGFRGDGLHLGSGLALVDERHNRTVKVRNCVFDGVNSNNRNGISIIDGEDVLIEDCQFLHCSRAGDGSINKGDPFNPKTGLMMPGAIDVEPNANDFAIARRITIRRNRFVGGGGYAVALNLRPNNALKVPHRTFEISDNVIEDRMGGLVASGFGGEDAATVALPYDVRFTGNTVSKVRWPFVISGLRGVTIADNEFRDAQDHAELGNTAGNAQVAVTGNLFERVGTLYTGSALWVRWIDTLTIAANRFVDCGLAANNTGIAIGLIAGNIRRLNIAGNDFSSPAGRMMQGITAFADAKFDRGSATIGTNRNGVRGLDVRAALGMPAG